MILPDREREPVRLDRWKEFKDGIKLLWRWGSLDPRRWHNADLGLSVGDGERHCHDVIDVFREYRLRGRWSNRSARIIASVAVFFLFSTVVMLLSGNPNIPYRGSSSFWWDRVTLWLSGFACLTLLMAAVDATRLCHWFIKTIERPSRRGNAPLLWPRHSFAGIQEVLDAESQAMHRTSAQTTCARDFPELNELLLIKTISMRTKVVEEGVVFSSIALLAMLIARNNLFDAWNWPIGLILMYGVSFGYAIWSLFDMRNFAVRVRGRSLARLEACHLARLINSSQNEDTERIAKVIALVRENQTGAFSPPLESPILKSLLIPTGGISAMALLQFLIGLK